MFIESIRNVLNPIQLKEPDENAGNSEKVLTVFANSVKKLLMDPSERIVDIFENAYNKKDYSRIKLALKNDHFPQFIKDSLVDRAFRDDDPKLLKLLIGAGANLTHPGSNPLYRYLYNNPNSKGSNKEKIASLLLESGNLLQDRNSIIALVESGYEQSIIDLAREKKITPEVLNQKSPVFQENILHQIYNDPAIVEDKKPRLMDFFIHLGADQFQADAQGRTPHDLLSELAQGHDGILPE